MRQKTEAADRAKSERTSIETATVSIPRGGGSGSENDDCFLVVGDDGTNRWVDGIAVVADGVGSSSAPADASRVAVDSWSQTIEHRFSHPTAPLSDYGETEFRHLIRECFAQAHRHVCRGAPGGSATAAGVCIQGRWLLVGTVGDSRVYLWRAGNLRQVTDDQIDAVGNPTDVLGGRAATPRVNCHAEANLEDGDWIVVGSDGLSKTVSPTELSSLLASGPSPGTAARAIRERAIREAIPDDVTVVFLRIHRVGSPFWERGSVSDRASDRTGESEPIRASASGTAVESGQARSSRRGSRHPEPGITGKAETERRRQEASVRGMDFMTDLEEIERRVSRIERSPSGMTQQEMTGLTREFERLDERIAGIEARLPRWPLGSLIVVIMVLLTLLGLAVGALFGSRDQSGFGSKPSATVVMNKPADYRKTIELVTTEDAAVLHYETTTGDRRIAVYRYADRGQVTMILRPPASGPAAGPASIGGSDSVSSDSPSVRVREAAPRSTRRSRSD